MVSLRKVMVSQLFLQLARQTCQIQRNSSVCCTSSHLRCEKKEKKITEKKKPPQARNFLSMGNTSSMLTQYDIEELQEHCSHAFSQQEIVSLYRRFCQLDRNSSGFISADEFLSVPEFAVNPLSQRLLRTVDGLNFKEFVAFLSAFSSRTTLQHKIEFIFKVYDLSCNGKVAFGDLLSVLRDLTGSFMTEQQRQKVLTHVLEEAGYSKDSSLVLSDFIKILGNSGLKMEVEVPID